MFRRDDKSRMDEKQPLLGPKSESKRKCYRTRNVILLLLGIVITALALTFIARQIIHYYTATGRTSPTVLTSIATVNNEYFEKCAPSVKCNLNSKYRTINGSCNNLANPTWGAALTPFYRYLDPEFSDGISKFRQQSDGSPLPNARRLTLKLFQNISHDCDFGNNELLVPWGQFVTHDVSYSPFNSVNSSFPAGLDHCGDKNPPVECEAAIRLYPDDPVYGKYNMTILKFMRLVTSKNYSCPLVPVTVLNQNTHYMDASNVYGSDPEVTRKLRLFSGGKLRYDKVGTEMYCPQDPTKMKKVAFSAGDVNVNQNLAIALFQNMFLRFHNYIANELQAKHPSWTDETIYQESRRIIGAVVQAITYNSYLPIILGERYMEEYGLTRKTNYDPTITASLTQEMIAGAFRLLHNTIPAKFNLISNDYTVYDEKEPSKLFLQPDSLIGNFDGLLRGLLETPGRKPQSSYNELISNIEFQTPLLNATGFDLLSYDIQRGRDVGLPPYTKMKKFCGFPLPNSFNDLSDHIPLESINQLKTLYSTVHDIDYFVGMLLESKINESTVGPTGRCVIADGFYRLRNGDRFFYDVQGQPGSFTPEQIRSLDKITLSHIICAASNVNHVQKEAFDLLDHIRMMKFKPNCETYKIDLTAW